jgi:predicted alpha/beta hydrolase family esterase
LLVPGLPGSGADRRQSAWLRQLPRFARLDLSDPERRDLDTWARAIVEKAMTYVDPVIVIAHGFGCLATIRASSLQSQLIAGALLVAPADPAYLGLTSRLAAPGPDFPTVLATSDSDPWLSRERAHGLASDWGSEVAFLRHSGNIAPTMGFTGWKVGLELLERLCQRVVSRTSASG